MKTKAQERDFTPDLFRSELIQIIDLGHKVCRLAKEIDWAWIAEEFDKLFPSSSGRPAKSARLIAGLFMLKAIYPMSDKDLVSTWLENPYWQYFCGEQYFQHCFPIDSSSMSKWRRRLKPEVLERLLEESIKVGIKTKVVKKRDLERVIVDTTVQEKAIAYPTDARLYHKARMALVRLAKGHEVDLRQSYERVGKHALFRSSNYARVKQFKRARKETRKLKTFLGCVYRDINRKVSGNDVLQEVFEELLENTNKLLRQKRNSKKKIYSMHAPEVECICKGKAAKRYEFGVKTSFATTHKSNFIVGATTLPGNPYDGHTLKQALDQVEGITGKRPNKCFVDRGYRGHGETIAEVLIARTKKKHLSRRLREALRRRNAVEPIIGHIKNDGRPGRNMLKGRHGDQIQAIMTAIGFNLRKILKHLELFWLFFIRIFLMPNY